MQSFTVSSSEQESFIVVAPLLKKIADTVSKETIDEPIESDSLEDTSFERALCGVWDLTTVHSYANVMYKAQLSRMLLKIITRTARTRTRELSAGILANLACHYDSIGHQLALDTDLLNVCRSILWYENDARVLLEVTRLLSSLFSFGAVINPLSRPQTEQTQLALPIEDMQIVHNLAFLLVPANPVSPSLLHQYVVIITNTLHTELLLTSLHLVIRITQFIYSDFSTNGVDTKINNANDNHNEATQNMDLPDVVLLVKTELEQKHVAKLVEWGLDRLEEQTRGVGIGMGLNRSIAKTVMHLLWLFLYYDLLVAEAERESECLIKQRLAPSVTAILAYIRQEDECDKSSDDKEIEQIADALTQLSF